MMRRDPTEKELLTGKLEASSNLGRIISGGLLAVPKYVRLMRGHLVWRGYAPATVKPSPETFDAFTTLWQAEDSAILEFAKKWGTLRRPLRLSQRLTKADLEGRESLSRWRDLSRHTFELLTISARLRSSEKATFKQWSELMSEERILSGEGSSLALGTREDYDKVEAIARGNLQRAVEASRAVIESMRARGINMDRLLRDDEHDILATHAEYYLEAEIAAWNTKLGPVSFRVKPDDDAPTGWRMDFDFGGSLPCYLGFQLMLAVAGGDVFICDSCHRTYIRPRGRTAPKGQRRLPAKGQLNYCQDPDCIRWRNRLAQARFREEHRKQEKSKEG